MGLILVVAFVRDDEDDMTTYQGAAGCKLRYQRDTVGWRPRNINTCMKRPKNC
jgi:hypothetical protein